MCSCVIETSSVLPWKCLVIFGNLQQSSEIFGKCLETIVWPSDNFWRIFGNLLKTFKKVVISMFIFIRLCLTRTGNYQIYEFDWLKWILAAV